MAATAMYDLQPRWNDRPPTYERLLVDTLVDIRRNAHKHALLTSKQPASRQPLSPYTPTSDGSSIHTKGTFDIDLKSIWSQKTAESTVDGLSIASSEPSSRASSPTRRRPRSLGDESFFPAPISPASFLPNSYDDDDDLDDDPLALEPEPDEPAPAYDAASSSTSHASTSTSVTHTHTRTTSSSIAGGSLTFDPSLLGDDNEDPWVAFAAIFWAAYVSDDPHNPPSHTFGRHTHARSAFTAVPVSISEEPESEPEPEPEHEVVSLAPMRYHSAFARTEPDLTVGIWSAGDNAVAHELGLEDELELDFDMEYTLDSRRLRPPRSRTPGVAGRVHKLEYDLPRASSPPRVFHKLAPLPSDVSALSSKPLPPLAQKHARNGSGGGFKRLWRWRGKENTVY